MGSWVRHLTTNRTEVDLMAEWGRNNYEAQPGVWLVDFLRITDDSEIGKLQSDCFGADLPSCACATGLARPPKNSPRLFS